jgi:restriction endonuclease S subunit
MSFNSKNDQKRDDFIKNTYKFGEICEVLNGRAYKKNELLESGKYTVLRVGNFFSSDNWYYSDLELDANKYCDNGDLLFAWSASFGPKIWDGGKVIYHYHIWKLVPSPFVDKKFLYYWLLFSRNKMLMGVHGSVMGHLTKSSFEKQKISLPDILEQKAIAHILSTLDDKIEVNNQINKTLENMAHAYFDDMFPNVAAGDTTIGEYITPKRGKNLLSKDAISGEVPVIAGGLSPATYHNVSNTQSPVITISASGANAGFVNLWTVPVWSSDSSFIDYGMTKDVYFWYVMLKKRQKEIYDSQTGSAQPHIYPKHITIMPTIKLNDDEINLYTKRVTPLFKKIANNLYEISKLQLIRDTLLPKLMSGKIRVPLDSEGDVS